MNPEDVLARYADVPSISVAARGVGRLRALHSALGYHPASYDGPADTWFKPEWLTASLTKAAKDICRGALIACRQPAGYALSAEAAKANPPCETLSESCRSCCPHRAAGCAAR